MNATTIPAPLQQAISHAKTKWLSDWLRDRLPEMVGLTDSDEDIAKAVVWGESLEALMIERGLDTPDKQKNRWTDTRNALKALDPDHPALKVVGLTTMDFLSEGLGLTRQPKALQRMLFSLRQPPPDRPTYKRLR